jgi:hypothetical protein
MSNNKQQTAVDLYRIKISILTTDLFNEKISGNQFRTLERVAYEQAKEMEKERIINAWKAGDGKYDKVADKLAEQYYEQTYGGGKQ